MQTQYVARTIDGSLTIRADSLTLAVQALADADGIARTSIATRQHAADRWHVYDSPDALDADPDGLYWFAEISVESLDYAAIF